MINYLGGKYPKGAKGATQAMLTMKKINLNALENAYLGE